MKAIISFFSLAFISLFASSGMCVVHADELTTYYYAQVTNANTYLYSFAQMSTDDNALFELPQSYFVLLISNYNDDFYKAQYRDLVGFVLKDEVSPVAETPESPYLTNITFRIYSSDGKSVYSAPTSKNSTVSTTAELLSSINYYGTISGEELVDGRGTTWFYCKANEKFGYVYAGYCDKLSAIQQNTESVTLISNPFEDDDNSYLYNLVEMTSGVKLLVLFLLIVPALVLVYLLFKPFKMEEQKAKIKSRSKAQTIKQIQDYYDDSL